MVKAFHKGFSLRISDVAVVDACHHH